MNFFKKLGFESYLAKDVKKDFVHELSTGSELPKPGFINDVQESKSFNVVDKPHKALWLSPVVDGQSDWRRWTVDQDWKVPSKDSSYKAVLNPNTVILELNEKTFCYIPKIWDENASSFVNNLDDFGFSNFDYSNILDAPMTPWVKLKEFGVSAVRVNGWTERGHFYGWDCDSLVILDGSSIVGWEKC